MHLVDIIFQIIKSIKLKGLHSTLPSSRSSTNSWGKFAGSIWENSYKNEDTLLSLQQVDYCQILLLQVTIRFSSSFALRYSGYHSKADLITSKITSNVMEIGFLIVNSSFSSSQSHSLPKKLFLPKLRLRSLTGFWMRMLRYRFEGHFYLSHQIFSNRCFYERVV